MFSNEDTEVIGVKKACRKGDSFVFASAYMAAEEPAPPNLLRDLFVFTENEQIPTIVGTDASAHHTIWKSSDINPRGEDLFEETQLCAIGMERRHRYISSQTRKGKLFWS